MRSFWDSECCRYTPHVSFMRFPNNANLYACCFPTRRRSVCTHVQLEVLKAFSWRMSRSSRLIFRIVDTQLDRALARIHWRKSGVRSDSVHYRQMLPCDLFLSNPKCFSVKAHDEQELWRLVYFGGIEPCLRKEVWPFLLGHYQFGMSENERKEVSVWICGSRPCAGAGLSQ